MKQGSGFNIAGDQRILESSHPMKLQFALKCEPAWGAGGNNNNTNI